MADVIPVLAASTLRGESAIALCTLSSHRACANQALPCCKGSPESVDHASQQTLIWKEGDAICLRILRRKNRSKGSGTLRRTCSCSGTKHLCAIHTLWDKFFNLLPDGSQPWFGMSPGFARARLRRILQILGIPKAEAFGTQDFR